MFLHTMDVKYGKLSYIQEVSREACERMYFYGSYHIGHIHILGLKSNEISTRSATLAGVSYKDGGCSGTIYSDPYGT